MALTLTDRAPSSARSLDAPSPVLLFGLASAVAFALSWQHLLDVWQSGTFFDTDDAMRMVQVRSWLAGQGWFDLIAHGVDPPAGLPMHWSRIVDVPLAVLLRIFGLFTDPKTAERLTRIVFPLALQAGLIAATIQAARALAGRMAALPAALLIVASGMTFGQFVAGRVDHHAPQIVLLMTMVGVSVATLRSGRPVHAIWLAAAISLSLGISLENLPFIAVLVAAQGLFWLAWGDAYARPLRCFGLALAVGAVVVFVATVPPARYLQATPDAFSIAQALAAVLGGLAFVALPRFGSAGLGRRAALLALAGGLTTGIVAGLFPALLQSPYGQIDPVVREVWLARVTEALPLTAAIQLHPQALTLIVCPMLAGMAAMLVAIWREQGRAQAAWLLVFALTVVGFCGCLWELRVVASTTPLALLGGAWAATAVTRAGSSAWRSLLVALPFAPMAWLIVPTSAEEPGVLASAQAAALCREASNVEPLAKLGDGAVFAPIDSGSHLLAHTHLSVFGAPYHRNNAGNRLVIDGFSADPATAGAIVRASGARYVAICPGQVQADVLRERAPHGLAAALLEARPPPWLSPLDLTGTRYKVFAVR